MASRNRPQRLSNNRIRPFYHPATWGPHVAFGLLRLLAWLPYRPLMALGRLLGRLARPLVTRRANIARINLELCFPALDAASRERLLREQFEAIGMGLMEIAMAWWWSERRLRPLVTVEGAEHIAPAYERGKGVIFFTGHFTSLELGGRLLINQSPVLPMLRPHGNPVVEGILARNRRRHVERIILRDNVRLMIRSLRANKGVWFAPDQNYGLKHSVFADFFGIPAATITSTSRFAAATGASVVPFVATRRAGGGYRLVIEPMLEDFPSADAQADTQRLNHILERWAREVPAQYFWVHRRFKDRPGDAPRFY